MRASVVERMHGRRIERLRLVPDYLVHDRVRGRAAVGSGSRMQEGEER